MSASDIISASSVMVALAAIGATIYQARLSHRHDRLSLQPFLAWSESYVQDDQGTTLCMAVENCGQGPAIIKDRWFEIDGTRYASNSKGSELVEEVAKRLLGSRVEGRLRQTGLIGGNSALPAGAKFVIAKVHFPGLDRSAVLDALAGGPKIDLVIEHESMHGERATFSALYAYDPRPAKRPQEASNASPNV